MCNLKLVDGCTNPYGAIVVAAPETEYPASQYGGGSWFGGLPIILGMIHHINAGRKEYRLAAFAAYVSFGGQWDTEKPAPNTLFSRSVRSRRSSPNQNAWTFLNT
jgi:hypothetical protein